jgi:dTMP kinase
VRRRPSRRAAAGPARAARREGRFVVLEGVDGAGTTTQAHRLGERLRAAGRKVHVTAEPSQGPAGTLVRQILRRRVTGPGGGPFDPAALALLFAADRLDHWASEIAPRLAEGVDVVSDRFTLSSLAYQGLEVADPGWVEAVNGRAAAPDVTVFLRARPAVALRRRRAAATDPEIFERESFQRRVAESYERAMDRMRARGEPVEIVDGERDPDEVADAVWAIVRRLG